jgi:hypothetical protein
MEMFMPIYNLDNNVVNRIERNWIFQASVEVGPFSAPEVRGLLKG